MDLVTALRLVPGGTAVRQYQYARRVARIRQPLPLSETATSQPPEPAPPRRGAFTPALWYLEEAEFGVRQRQYLHQSKRRYILAPGFIDTLWSAYYHELITHHDRKDHAL